MKDVLAILLETIRQVVILIQPVMPTSAARLLDQLQIEEGQRDFTSLGSAGRAQINKDTAPIATPEGVFPRYVEESGEGA
jgi:methionyl-tRNA synthetase